MVIKLNGIINYSGEVKNTFINMVNDAIKYLERLSKDDLLVIIKYGLRNSNAPEDVTVEDIFNIIGCKFIELK